MERRKDLDFAKGIGIILMVLGHCYSAGNGELIRTWFYSFHMPLFFIIPGILMRERNTVPLLFPFLRKRIYSLLIPYFFWGIIAALFLTVLGRKPLNWLLVLIKCVFSFEGLSAMWFLPCLFLAECLFLCFLKATNRNRILGYFIAATFALVGFSAPKTNIYITIILRSFTGASFLFLGWFLSEFFSRPSKGRIWIIVAAIHAFLSMCNDQISVLDREYGNFVLFYANALLGSWLVIQAYHLLAALPLQKAIHTFIWFGQNSLIMVCTSLYAIEFLRLADSKLFSGFLPRLGNFEGLALCALSVLLESMAIFICNKFLWFTFGKKKK